MSKLPPRRVPSDDCLITLNGEQYPLHTGEWIEVIPSQPLSAMKTRIAFLQLIDELRAQDNPTDAAMNLVGADGEIWRLCESLSQLIVAWNWTDNDGKPLPNPHNAPEVIQQLSDAEVIYLIAATQPEVAAERKNGFRPSPITSSAIVSRPIRKRSNTARSHTKP